MHRQLEAAALGLLMGLLGALASCLPLVADLEQDLELRWLFHLRGATQAPAEVVVVAIDEPSALRLELPREPSQWPRDIHARLTDRLARAGAAVICFDVSFDTPGRLPHSDAGFAAAIGRAGNVVLTDALRRETAVPTNASGQATGEIRIETISPPVPILESAALAHAPFLLPRAPRVDAYWTFKSDAADAPTLPTVALQAYAFRAYPAFVDLLRRAAPRLDVAPPTTLAELLNPSAGGGVDSAVRRLFLEDPEVGERLSKRLDDSGDSGLPADRMRLVRALLGLYRSDEIAYLNFHGPPQTIRTVPYYQVLARSEDAAQAALLEQFRGKAVFVGYSASSQPEQDRIRDDYETVFSRADGLNLSGVEIAATAFANLLHDRPVRPLPTRWRLGLLALWGLAIGFACRMLRPVPATALASAAVMTYLGIAVRVFGTTGLWLPLLVPLCLQAPLSLIRGLWANYRDARRERERIRQAAGYFLPRAVIDRVLEKVGPVTSADQLAYGACLATDLEKYTALAEKMPPQELVRLMNEYYAELFKPVERLGGVVSNLSGDAMLAIWAASTSQVAARQQACLAAFEIAEALERFNQRFAEGQTLRTRLGLHSGQMLLGSVGASRHYQYEAMGDMINTAARIQGLSKHLGTRMLASEETILDVQGLLTRPLGRFLLAGKSAPVSVVELLGRAQDATPQSIQLRDEFAQALLAYRDREWGDATRHLSAILRRFPEDGPSRFYQQRCHACLRDPPDETWRPTIRIEQK